MDYVTRAKRLFSIAEDIKGNNCSFDKIPFAEIIADIQQVYGYKTNSGDFFSLIYGKIITRSLELGDSNMLENVILLLAHHLMIFASDESEINIEKKECLIYKERYYVKQSLLAHLQNCIKNDNWHANHQKNGVTHFYGKGVVYSAITGDYDDVKEPEYINPNLDYILFTDNPNLKSNVWDVRLIAREKDLDSVRMARKIKILGHEYLADYDYSIWVDGKIGIIGDLEEYVQKYRSREPILCFNHYINDCIYEEFDVCTYLKKDSIDIMQKQIDRYRSEGYPEHNGLIESAILVRDFHDKKLQKVMKDWWSEIINGSRRDQLSFNYACWKNDFLYDTTDLYIYINDYVKLYHHN